MSDSTGDKLQLINKADLGKEDESKDFGSIQKEKTIEDKDDPEIRTYCRRWYVLTMFTVSAMVQGLVWNTWGPIADSSILVFGWGMWDLALLPNWACLVSIVATLPITWLLETRGLRLGLVVSNALVALGTGLRCITSQPPAATWLIHTCAILNGLAGPVSMVGPPVLSSIWFQPHERATSTAISSIFVYIGISSSFILGPLLVDYDEPVRKTIQGNISLANEIVGTTTSYASQSNSSILLVDPVTFERQKNGIMNLMYIEFVLAAMIFLVTLIYFPNKPPKPPSISASVARENWSEGVCDLVRSKDFWIIALVFSIPGGLFIAWSSVLDLVLGHLELGQKIVGYLGFFSTITACFTGVAAGRLSDSFPSYMKLIIYIFYTISAGFLTWFAAMCSGISPIQTAYLFVAAIVGIAMLNGTLPLFFEMSCETAYPVAECVTGGILVMMENLVSAILLGLLWIPDIGTIWINWSLPISLVVALTMLIFYKEKYNRLKLDDPGSGD